MNRFNATTIEAAEVAERLKEDLKDFHQSGMIKSIDFREKATFSNILKAINHADRVVCRDNQIDKMVVVYVPANTTNLFFSQNSQNIAEIQTAISGLNLSDINESVFLDTHSYLYISEINDRYLYVYDDYPVGAELSERRIRKVGANEFYGPDEHHGTTMVGTYSDAYNSYRGKAIEGLCHYSPTENRLILGKAFATPGFLRFNARIFPGILKLSAISKTQVQSNDYNAYSVIAPHYAFELLLAEAMMYLLPKSANDARIMTDRERQREDFRYQKMRPTDRNVVVPDYSF